MSKFGIYVSELAHANFMQIGVPFLYSLLGDAIPLFRGNVQVIVSSGGLFRLVLGRGPSR